MTSIWIYSHNKLHRNEYGYYAHNSKYVKYCMASSAACNQLSLNHFMMYGDCFHTTFRLPEPSCGRGMQGVFPSRSYYYRTEETHVPEKLHSHRASRCHRDHRDSRLDAAAGPVESAGTRQGGALHQQPETVRNGFRNVRERS